MLTCPQIPATREVPPRGTFLRSNDDFINLIQDLSRDRLANHIINKVNVGPFGPAGRTNHPFSTTKEDFLASITGDLGDSMSEQSGSSTQDAQSDLSFCSPSSDWQDRLKIMLHSIRAEASASAPFNLASPPPETKMRRATYPSSTSTHPPVTYMQHTAPLPAPTASSSTQQFYDYRAWSQNSDVRNSANEISSQPHTMIPNIYTDPDGRQFRMTHDPPVQRGPTEPYSPVSNPAPQYYGSFRR
ncbi:hypothetical protein BN946_scf184760.g15 [Trametes cinnabarina]|uniref:Uncharacterized protein n=1 Tax=Pycnoporus cinnabarinus TaxID=5643 RepID=A0A060S859_PYCCI|nr:hypothetical protein BN946_scf184760.g15 [Trametes cinnabarina]